MKIVIPALIISIITLFVVLIIKIKPVAEFMSAKGIQ